MYTDDMQIEYQRRLEYSPVGMKRSLFLLPKTPSLLKTNKIFILS